MNYKTDALLAGTILSQRYEVKELIGMGGSAFVYRAYDKILQKNIAVKELFPLACCKRNPDQKNVVPYSKNAVFMYENYKKFFFKEAAILAQCKDCSNILSVFGLFEENNTAYLVMEFLDGITLQQYILNQKEPLSEKKIIYITLEVLNALSFLHQHGLFHQDIASNNIFLTSSGDIKLIDFGSAIDRNSPVSGTVILKASYAPPEQYISNGIIGAWTDIYALGAVMYESATKRKVPAAKDRRFKDEMVSPKEINSQISERLDFIIMKALALDAEKRFQTAEEFRNSISENNYFESNTNLYRAAISIRIKMIIGLISFIICCMITLLVINK